MNTGKRNSKKTVNKNILNLDCRYFPSDRPCFYHKAQGQKCFNCKYYLPIKQRILIIKLDAMGDVLRTTFLLDYFKNKYPSSHITWIVSENSSSVIKNNPLIDSLLVFNAESLTALLADKYDIAINLDLSYECLNIIKIVKSKIKYGFTKDSKGNVKPLNKYAKNWLLMSAFDDVKKANKLTYQELAALTCGFKFNDEEIIVPVGREQGKYAEQFFNKHKLNNSLKIGLNIGSGLRWKSKRWPLKYWQKLIELLQKQGYKPVIFGGPQEILLEEKLIKTTNVISAGMDNSIPRFFALLDKLDILVTGDTLALHAALGLKKKVIVLFGPTSPNEIYMYNLGTKIVADRECSQCYKNECDKHLECLSKILPKEVFKVIKSNQI